MSSFISVMFTTTCIMDNMEKKCSINKYNEILKTDKKEEEVCKWRVYNNTSKSIKVYRLN